MAWLTTPILVILILATIPLPAHASERMVHPGHLADALAQAQPGDTLKLLPGVHPGPLTVARSVQIVGEPGAIIGGSGQGTVLTLAADGIRVSDLTVRGSGADLAQDDAVILLYEAQSITVERCQVEARAFGIYLRAGGTHHIVGNVVRGDASLPSVQRGNGIHLWHSEKNEVRDNALIDVRDGIYLSFAHENRIAGNEGSRLRYGIHYMYSERNTLGDNRFSNCTGGIALMFSMGNRIEGNRVTNNRDFGILCQQLERTTLAHNDIVDNGRGFYLENSACNRFLENRIEGNGVGAYLTAGSEENVFTQNRFDNNLVQVFQEHAGANDWSEHGRGNAWSDYTGFDWNGDGVGETPYQLQTAASALMARRPLTRWFWMSPLFALLDWWDKFIRPPDALAIDPAPLVSEVHSSMIKQ